MLPNRLSYQKWGGRPTRPPHARNLTTGRYDHATDQALPGEALGSSCRRTTDEWPHVSSPGSCATLGRRGDTGGKGDYPRRRGLALWWLRAEQLDTRTRRPYLGKRRVATGVLLQYLVSAAEAWGLEHVEITTRKRPFG